jgi:hypothetical protein
MRYSLLTAGIFISILGFGQNTRKIKKLEPVYHNFHFIINDLEFRGTGWICTAPFTTIFTKIIYDDSAATLHVEGRYLFRNTDVSDSGAVGFGGAHIYLLNVDEQQKVQKFFDLGSTEDEFRSPKHFTPSGFFSRTFSISQGDILLIGLSGIGGATAFYVGELLNKY